MDTKAPKILFEKYKLGDLTLSNRFIMASMTRSKADKKTNIPSDIQVLYYSQRASAGLILTESIPIANNAQAFMGNGGLFSSKQAQGWKRVNDAVHAKGGKIFAQLWHGGRSAIPALNGEQNIAPSAICINGELFPGVAFEQPREMTKEDIRTVLGQFKQAAIYAKEAGFDGVELHGAYGFLIDQFLKESSNLRTDEYGGSIENRSRFCLEAIDLLIEVYGAKRVGIKLSPVGRRFDIYDGNPVALFSYLLKELDKRGIAYVQLVEPADKNYSPEQVEPEKQMPSVCKALRSFFKGTIMINNKQTPESASKAIQDGDADIVAFGTNFIGNPDYVERIRNGWELSTTNFTTLYADGETGYTDYPFYKAPKSLLF